MCFRSLWNELCNSSAMNCAIPVWWTMTKYNNDELMDDWTWLCNHDPLNFLVHNKWTISTIIHLFTRSKLHGSFVINYVNIFSSQSAQVGQLWPAIIRCTLCVVQRASTIYLNIFFFGYAHLILTNIHRNDPY